MNKETKLQEIVNVKLSKTLESLSPSKYAWYREVGLEIALLNRPIL